MALLLNQKALPISRKYITDKTQRNSFEVVKALNEKWMFSCLHLAQEENVSFLKSKPLHLCK